MKYVNVAEMMSYAENKEFVANFVATLEQDTESAKIMENSTSVEDMFKVVSRYFQLKLEDFTEAYHKAVDYLTQPKAKLDDGVMECVVGGGIGDWFKRNWRTIAAVAVGVAAVGIGMLTCGIGAGLIASGMVLTGAHSIVCGGLAIAGGTYVAATSIDEAVNGENATL